jgi:hypothetical protein
MLPDAPPYHCSFKSLADKSEVNLEDVTHDVPVDVNILGVRFKGIIIVLMRNTKWWDGAEQGTSMPHRDVYATRRVRHKVDLRGVGVIDSACIPEWIRVFRHDNAPMTECDLRLWRAEARLARLKKANKPYRVAVVGY